MKIGIIGTGNMGSAILKGIAPYYMVYAYDVDKEKLKQLSKISAFEECSSEEEVAKYSDYIIIAVKPDKVKTIIDKIKKCLNKEKCIISIAAGISSEKIKKWSNGLCSVIRVMPNTPCLVNKGVLGVCFDKKKLTQKQKDFVLKMLQHIGKVYEVEEKNIDAFTALVGCGPAYFYYFLEALIEAGITIGFSKEKSKELIFELIDGSLSLAKNFSLSISELKYMITSPEGATIYALNLLDRKSTKANIIDAVTTAYKRCKELNKD